MDWTDPQVSDYYKGLISSGMAVGRAVQATNQKFGIAGPAYTQGSAYSQPGGVDFSTGTIGPIGKQTPQGTASTGGKVAPGQATPGTTSGAQTANDNPYATQLDQMVQAFMSQGYDAATARTMAVKILGGAPSTGGSSGPSPAELAIAQQNADTNSRQADIQAAQQAATAAYQAGQQAVAEGNLDLARQQFAEAQKQNGIANQLQTQQNTIAQQNANTNVQNANINQQNADTSAFTAGSNSKIGQANAGIAGFTALNDALNGRQQIGLGGGNLFGNLANTSANLLDAQGKLALQIMTTPRNAIAGLLLNNGVNGMAGASRFNPANLYGMTPATVQGYLNSGAGAAQNAVDYSQKTPDYYDKVGGLLNSLLSGNFVPPMQPGQPTQTQATTTPNPMGVRPVLSATDFAANKAAALNNPNTPLAVANYWNQQQAGAPTNTDALAAANTATMQAFLKAGGKVG